MSLFKLFGRKNNGAEPIFSVLGTDMHCHLVPAVDDGSKCMEESIDCLKTLKEVGFEHVIVTPHYSSRFPNEEEDIKQRYGELKRAAEEAGVTIDMAGIAGEYRIDANFKARLETPRFLKVGGKYVLVEFSLHHQMADAYEMLFELQMQGYELILAHPERYPYLSLDGERMEQLLNQGVYLQCNVLSLGGFYGEEARRRAFELIERKWVSFLGTDTHNVLYAQALSDLTHQRKVQRVLEKYEFKNKELLQ